MNHAANGKSVISISPGVAGVASAGTHTVAIDCLGYDSVSVAPYFLPEIKYAVRRTTLAAAQDLAAEVLAADSVEGVKRALSTMRERLHF